MWIKEKIEKLIKNWELKEKKMVILEVESLIFKIYYFMVECDSILNKGRES